MALSISKSVLVYSVLVCLGCSGSYQEVIQTAAGKKGRVNHGCPSWFVPINNSSDRCKCGEPIQRPGRVVRCDPNANQTRVRSGYCMDYDKNKDEVFVGKCRYINFTANIYGVYEPPQNAATLNHFLCGGLNRTGVMCSQCQEGLGTAIFSYSMQCLPCMNSGLGWTLYTFLATFPTTILFLAVLILQCRCITSGPMNAFILACQLGISTVNYKVNTLKGTNFHVIMLGLFTICGIWNLDYLLPPFCVSDQIGPLHVIALEYVVAFYPLLLISSHCIYLYSVTC